MSIVELKTEVGSEFDIGVVQNLQLMCDWTASKIVFAVVDAGQSFLDRLDPFIFCSLC